MVNCGVKGVVKTKIFVHELLSTNIASYFTASGSLAIAKPWFCMFKAEAYL